MLRQQFPLRGQTGGLLGDRLGIAPTSICSSARRIWFIDSPIAPSSRVLGSQLVARSSTRSSTCATRLAEKAPIASISSTSSAKPIPSLTPTFKSDSIRMASSLGAGSCGVQRES